MRAFKEQVSLLSNSAKLFDGTEATEEKSLTSIRRHLDISQETMLGSLNDLVSCVHYANVARGWWHNIETLEPTQRNIGTLYALFFTELGEAFEGYRTNVPSKKIDGFTNEEEELADVLVRLFDYAAPRKLRLWEAFYAKLNYNLSRPDHSLAARRSSTGKKV